MWTSEMLLRLWLLQVSVMTISFNVLIFHLHGYNLLSSLTGSSQVSAPFEQLREKTWKNGLNYSGLLSLLLKCRWKLCWSHEACVLVPGSNAWFSHIMCIIVVISWNHSWFICTVTSAMLIKEINLKLKKEKKLQQRTNTVWTPLPIWNYLSH